MDVPEHACIKFEVEQLQEYNFLKNILSGGMKVLLEYRHEIRGTEVGNDSGQYKRINCSFQPVRSQKYCINFMMVEQ